MDELCFTRSVERLESYVWSSYPDYLGLKQPFEWMEMSLTRELMGSCEDPIKAYREFVMQGNDEETAKFHKSGRIGVVFGSELFRSWVFDDLMPQLKNEKRSRVITPNLAMQSVICAVASFYQVAPENILVICHGRVIENLPRKVAMYLCQKLTVKSQAQIAEVFNIGHYCSVGRTTHEVRMRKQTDFQLGYQIEEIIKMLVKL